MTEPYTVNDLVSLSYDQKPVEFQDAFNTVLADKITSAIDNYKVNIAQTVFASPVEDDSNDQYEEEEDYGANA